MKYKHTLHVDWDYEIPEAWERLWREVAENTLEHLGYQLKRVIKKPSPSGKGGSHLWLHITSPKELSDEEINMLQWLVGLDCPTRVWINRMRINRGLHVYWNKLFERHLFRKPLPEQCEKCRLRRILYEMKKEMKDA